MPTLSPEHPFSAVFSPPAAPVSSRPISPRAQHPQPWKMTQPQGHLQKVGLGLSQLLSPSHATGVSSGNADSVKTRWLSCSPCQHHSNLQWPGGVLAGIPVEGQEALVRAGRGSGPAYHNIPCRPSHCVQGSTLKNERNVLGPALVSCGLHMEGIQSQRMSTTAWELSWPFKAPFVVQQFEAQCLKGVAAARFPHPKRNGEEI